MKKALKSLKVELAQFDFARSTKVSGISSCPISELRYGCLFPKKPKYNADFVSYL